MQLKQAEQPRDFGQPPGGPDGGAPGDEQEGEPDDGGGGDELDDMAAQNPPQQDDGGQAPAAGPEQGGGAPGGDEQQFGKAVGGGNPNHDPKNGRFTSGDGGGVIFSRRYGGVTLYHGTTPEAKAAIDQQGVMRGPVFFSPSKSAATDYASDGESVVEVNVPADALCVDFDLPGARLLTVDDANEYTGNDWTLDDYIDAGYSVGINESLVVDKAAYEAAGGDAMAKASHGGNPNHDPETGRFTSGSARTPQMRMDKRGLR